MNAYIEQLQTLQQILNSQDSVQEIVDFLRKQEHIPQYLKQVVPYDLESYNFVFIDVPTPLIQQVMLNQQISPENAIFLNLRYSGKTALEYFISSCSSDATVPQLLLSETKTPFSSSIFPVFHALIVQRSAGLALQLNSKSRLPPFGLTPYQVAFLLNFQAEPFYNQMTDLISCLDEHFLVQLENELVSNVSRFQFITKEHVNAFLTHKNASKQRTARGRTPAHYCYVNSTNDCDTISPHHLLAAYGNGKQPEGSSNALAYGNVTAEILADAFAVNKIQILNGKLGQIDSSAFDINGCIRTYEPSINIDGFTGDAEIVKLQAANIFDHTQSNYAQMFKKSRQSAGLAKARMFDHVIELIGPTYKLLNEFLLTNSQSLFAKWTENQTELSQNFEESYVIAIGWFLATQIAQQAEGHYSTNIVNAFPDGTSMYANKYSNSIAEDEQNSFNQRTTDLIKQLGQIFQKYKSVPNRQMKLIEAVKQPVYVGMKSAANGFLETNPLFTDFYLKICASYSNGHTSPLLIAASRQHFALMAKLAQNNSTLVFGMRLFDIQQLGKHFDLLKDFKISTCLMSPLQVFISSIQKEQRFSEQEMKLVSDFAREFVGRVDEHGDCALTYAMCAQHFQLTELLWVEADIQNIFGQTPSQRFAEYVQQQTILGNFVDGEFVQKYYQ
ncbi:Hypothetical_protein [Hexamita inflata]|uniref:Hypothetical_protein n=1 Tax=Hexamita inflata TaxID=28002 RepID=A0AA86P9H9_9EUKA|nr:Hypothetical protein HINF_LOCUS22369 [Hexamita inflata]